jgi:hypothetical protein
LLAPPTAAYFAQGRSAIHGKTVHGFTLLSTSAIPDRTVISRERSIPGIWAGLVPGFSLNERGQQSLKKWLRKYPLDNVLEAMQRSVEQYIIGTATSENVEAAWKYVARICNVMAADEKKPYLKDILYIRGILRNRLSWCDEQIALDKLEDAHIRGVTLEQLTRLAKRSTSWKCWSAALDDLVAARLATPPINERIRESAVFAPLLKELEHFDEYELERVFRRAASIKVPLAIRAARISFQVRRR